jgi:hypothetical protein
MIVLLFKQLSNSFVISMIFFSYSSYIYNNHIQQMLIHITQYLGFWMEDFEKDIGKTEIESDSTYISEFFRISSHNRHAITTVTKCPAPV